MLEVIGHNTMPGGCSLPAKFTVTRRAGWGINVCVTSTEKTATIRRVNGIFIT